jgi:hypothetical protein
MKKLYRRTLATACTVVALATTACGSSSVADTAGGPTPSPVTAATVSAALNHSKMKSGHFRLIGTLIKQPSYFPVTGNGVLQLAPREGFLMNLSVQTYSSQGTVKMQSISIGGKDYSRVGNGAWASKPSKNSPTKPSSYIGEETVAGSKVWHARSVAPGSIYDMWIRESDGYIVQLALSLATGNFTMTFDSYNKSPAIRAP